MVYEGSTQVTYRVMGTDTIMRVLKEAFIIPNLDVLRVNTMVVGGTVNGFLSMRLDLKEVASYSSCLNIRYYRNYIKYITDRVQGGKA